MFHRYEKGDVPEIIFTVRSLMFGARGAIISATVLVTTKSRTAVLSHPEEFVKIEL